jgi:hypothetical protein
VKIGSTVGNPARRLSQFQLGCPLRLRVIGLLNGMEQELILHMRFADRRLHGEWFHPSILDELDLPFPRAQDVA